MPKIQYKEINFRGKSLELINLVNQVINEYKNQGYELTLRQTYYQLVARGYIPNNERSYKNIGNLINDGRSEVQAENEQKIADHMDEVDKAIDQAFPGQEEVPFDEAMDVADKVPKPDLQKPPRRTRKERNAEKSEPVQDGTTNTDSESVTLKADAYFYVPADDNYVMKHKGDTVDLIVDGVEVMKVITREEFNAGIKRLAQENNPVPADAQTPAEPLDGAMNPPEQHVRGQRRRRTRS